MVVGWAAYLVPYWFHRHDASSEMRSIHGFSTAMRTLSRRTATQVVDGRYVVVPRQAADAPQPSPVHVSGAGVRRAVQSQQLRRQRVLFSLATLALVSVPAAVLVGGRLRWLPVGALLCLFGYAARLRRRAVLAAARRHRERQLALQHKVERERLAYLQRTATAPSPARTSPPQQPSYGGSERPSRGEDAVAAEVRRVVGG